MVLFEPFNFVTWEKDKKFTTIDIFENQENVLIKTFIDKDNYPYESFKNVNDYWDWVYTYFDKIIVLERENKRLQAESLLYHIKLSKNHSTPINWHKQKYYELTEEDETDIQGITKHLESEANFLKEISDKGYPLFTFEEIFERKEINKINDLFSYLNLTINQKCVDEWIYSPYKKVRIEKKSKNLI
jgi:hypothetical protein